jgi:hypothetical protein
MNAAPRALLRGVPLREGFELPSTALAELLEGLGCKLFAGDWDLAQYVAWADGIGLFSLMEAEGGTTLQRVCLETPLNERGADALLGVLCALGLIRREPTERYVLTRRARDYLLRSSPFFVGDQLYARHRSLPRQYLRGSSPFISKLQLKLLAMVPVLRYGTPSRLRNQHARNIEAGAAAVRTGQFASVNCLVEIAGGSGTFAIPLALEYPRMRVVLTEIPRALANIRHFLEDHGLESRVELIGLDLFSRPWLIPSCDGLFIGNVLHGFDDATCLEICRECFKHLQSGGKIWLHEMIWNEDRNGPLLTALWNATMRYGEGRQRSARELETLLEKAGFNSTRVIPASGAFALIRATKP